MSTNHSQHSATTLRWGRSRWGSRPGAWRHAAPLGVILAVVLGIAFSLIGFDTGQRWLAWAVGTACLAGPALAAAWVVVVDRSTIRGAVERPEESVENDWWDTAAQRALVDTFVIAGLGAAVLSLTRREVTGTATLLAVAGFIAVDVAVRYALARRAS